jgi:hypothetical protein
MVIPLDYSIQKFYQYAGLPKYNRLTRTHQGCCPICREGKSWGRKKRCYFILDENVICCHNCGWYSAPFKWIETAGNMSYDEIVKESKNYDILPLDLLQDDSKPVYKPVVTSKLPKDSINLFDSNQVEYYQNNTMVQNALSLIKKRHLDTAVNKPDSLWISLTDRVHKNRLIIPFYNDQNEIIFYQSRTILDKDSRLYPKYLSKVNSEKSLYGMNKISSAIDYIFIFEGPIDAFFVKNGVAVAGIQENSNNMFTNLQQSQLLGVRLQEKIWVLDSQWLDMASRSKTDRLIKQGERVFIWPEKLGTIFKDINEICVMHNKNEIDYSYFINNSYTGLKAEMMMIEINRFRRR